MCARLVHDDTVGLTAVVEESAVGINTCATGCNDVIPDCKVIARVRAYNTLNIMTISLDSNSFDKSKNVIFMSNPCF